MAKKKKEKKPVDLKPIKELLYMSINEITAHDLKEAVTEKDNMVTEFWEDMNIFQIELNNGNSVDFEPMDVEFKEENDQVFIKNRNVKTIFYITVQDEDFEEIRPVLWEVLSKLGGFICTDSENFQPIFTVDKL